MKTQCPICKKAIPYPKNTDDVQQPWLPFCSERCKLIDLGRWLDADYRIPAKADENGTADEEEHV